MKKMLLATLLAIWVTLIVTPIGYGGNPLPSLPPDCEYANHYMGPDITGTFTFTNKEDGNIEIKFDGSCRNQPLDNPIPLTIPFPWDCVSQEWLLGICEESCFCNGSPQMFPYAYILPYGCDPKKDNAGLPIIYNVIKFNDNGDTKTAKIVAKFSIILCPK
jgi:hypothetical protein